MHVMNEPMKYRLLPIDSLVQQSRQQEVDNLTAARINSSELNQLAQDRELYLKNTIDGIFAQSCPSPDAEPQPRVCSEHVLTLKTTNVYEVVHKHERIRGY